MTTFKEKLQYLVCGYVSKEVKNAALEDKYPSELNMLIIEFLGNIIMRFDTVHAKYRDCIQNDGKLLVRDNESMDISSWDNFSILSSYAFTAGIIGQFSIKCNKPQWDSIGIMSNTDIVMKENIYHSDGNALVYYIHLDGFLYKRDSYDGEGEIVEEITEDIVANDVITVKVNCVEWKVAFMINDQVIGKIIDITPNENYHPFVGFFVDDAEYELLV